MDKITITKDQLVGVLLDSGRFPEQEEDFIVMDEIWDELRKEVVKVYRCCPFCESKNITEESLEHLSEMERFPTNYKQGTCVACGNSWNNLR